MSLPSDDNILLSLVNTKLRDGEDLSGLCAQYGVEEDVLLARLAAAGYKYDGDGKSFKRF